MTLQFYDLTTFRIFSYSHLVELLFFASSNCVLEKKVKQKENAEGWANIVNPETQATIGTRHRIKTYKTTTKHSGKLTLMQRDPSKKNKKTTTRE